MELEQLIYKDLLAWKSENTGRVLELQGARQVGKTYILKKFAKENFRHCLCLPAMPPGLSCTRKRKANWTSLPEASLTIKTMG